MIEQTAEFPTLTIIRHPLVQHKLTILRDRDTPTKIFKELVDEIAMLMAYEATIDLTVEPMDVETPLESTVGRHISGKKLTLVPILRAGLGMVEGILRLVPAARVGHIGLYRDHDTLQPVDYYFKIPGDVAERDFFVLDPMLATGGSAAAAVDSLKKAGATRIRFLCLVAAPEGVRRLASEHPDVQVYCAALDRELNTQGYILPGLGDAGDRLFGTRRRPLAKPLLRVGPLLIGGGENPMLTLGVRHFVRNAVEPVSGLTQIAHTSPKLANQISEDRPFLDSDSVIAAECLLEAPCRQPAEVSLRFDIIFIDAAPGSTEQKIRNLTRLDSLPLGHLRRGFIFCRP